MLLLLTNTALPVGRANLWTALRQNSLFTHFKGAMAEQYVCQQLVGNCGLTPYYWSAKKSSGEIDFVVQVNGPVVPIEVKAKENLKAKSLTSFCKTGSGLLNPVREVGALAHKYGAFFIADSTSAYAMIPINAYEDNIDFCMASAHKIS